MTELTRDVLQVWSECDDVQDYVTVYDGYTTRDAILLKFCGGGEPVPEAVSSGPELLVEFTSSPYGTFVYPAPPQALHGFQLEVQVRVAVIDPQPPQNLTLFIPLCSNSTYTPNTLCGANLYRCLIRRVRQGKLILRLINQARHEDVWGSGTRWR
jgi:hypothetical protein